MQYDNERAAVKLQEATNIQAAEDDKKVKSCLKA